MKNNHWIKSLKPHRQGQLLKAYQDFAAQEYSRIILKDLAHYCHFNQTSFMPNMPEYTAFNEGARDVFLHILEMMNVKPQSLIGDYEHE